MSRWRPTSRRAAPRTFREQLERNQQSENWYAAMAGKPPVENSFLKAMGPKRIRKPSTSRSGTPSEHQEQSAVISWWALQHNNYGLPTFALFAVPNGGARDAITGGRLKDEGVRRGALDLILAKPSDQFHGLFLEMKVGSNKPTPEQNEYIDYLRANGYAVSVHWSADSAISAIKEYLQC